MHKVLHPRDDTDRLYASRKERGRGFASIEDSVATSIRRLTNYIKKNKERLITATRNNTNNTRVNRTTLTKKQKSHMRRPVRKHSERNIQRETESLLIAAQINAIKTNYVKEKIDNTQQNSKCRLYSDRNETINHIISECSKLEQKEYKIRHDWMGQVIQWEFCKKFKFNQRTYICICKTRN